MRALVCGGRFYEDRKALNRALSEIHAETPITLLIEGGATGADYLAKLWAQVMKIPVCEFPANWKFQGKASGPIRNRAMLEFGLPSVVIAFPGTHGTQNMISQAIAAGVRVIDCPPPHPPERR